MKNFKGIVYAALSSSTFGLAPLFSILLLSDGFSSFEVLSYRWGVASLTLGIVDSPAAAGSASPGRSYARYSS